MIATTPTLYIPPIEIIPTLLVLAIIVTINYVALIWLILRHKKNEKERKEN
jgi:hypothetical protein